MSDNRLKGSERQKMLINYVKDGIVPEGFYVKTTKNGMIQFRRIKETNSEALIQKYEEKIKVLRARTQSAQDLMVQSAQDPVGSKAKSQENKDKDKDKDKEQ